MPIDPVVDYIKSQLKAGYSLEDIRNSLLDAGHERADVDIAIGIVRGGAPVPKANKEPASQELKQAIEGEVEAAKETIRHHIVAAFALSMIAGIFVINDIFSSIISSFVSENITNIFINAGLATENFIYVNIVLAAGIIAGSVLVYKSKKPSVSAALIMAFSIVYFALSGSVVVLALGLIGGVLGMMKV